MIYALPAKDSSANYSCCNMVPVMKLKWYMLQNWISIANVIRLQTFFDESGKILRNISILKQTLQTFQDLTIMMKYQLETYVTVDGALNAFEKRH